MLRSRTVRLITPVCLVMGAMVPLVTAADAAPAAAHVPTIAQSFNGIFNRSLTPMDANGAAGPSSYIEDINVNLAIYSRTGTLMSTASFAGITGHGSLSDPMVLWDPDTQRFYYNIWDTSNNQMAWGFSKSSNPTNASRDFCSYSSDFQYARPKLTDYPKLGQSKGFLMIGVNVYPNPSALHATSSDLLWINKPQGRTAITTCPPATTFSSGKFVNLRNADGSQGWTPTPAIQTDPSADGYISTSTDIECPDICGTGSLITEFTLSPSAGNPKVPTLSAPRSVTVAPFAPPAKAPQKGSTFMIDTLDGRLDHSVSGVDPRFGTTAVWVAHTVKGGAGAAIAWYEIDPVGGALLQSGLIADPKLYIYNAGITNDRTVDATGAAAHGSNMVMSLTTSSARTFITAAMVSKLGAAATSAPVVVHSSTRPETDFSCTASSLCRWGDYAGATPDPASPLTGAVGNVWCTNEYAQASGVQGTWNWEATP